MGRERESRKGWWREIEGRRIGGRGRWRRGGEDGGRASWRDGLVEKRDGGEREEGKEGGGKAMPG